MHWSLKYQGVERPNLIGLSCRLRFECRMTLLTLYLTPERWMDSRVQSTVGWFTELYFLQFFVAQVLVGLQKQFMNNFVFPTWAVLLFLIIIMVIIAVIPSQRPLFAAGCGRLQLGVAHSAISVVLME